MDNHDILDMIGDAKGKFLLEAQRHREGKAAVKRLSMKRLWLVAACIVLALLLVGCAVVYVLRMQDMAFGTRHQEYYDGSSREITLLSIQGIKGSPGYQATKEWYEWLETYDTDMSVYHSEEAFSEDFGDDYYAYNLYSREMKDKLDEICGKYGLELLGKMYVDPDLEAACEAMQIPGIFRPGTSAEGDWGSDGICYYANGAFRLEGHMTLAPGEISRIVIYRCHRKDAFSDLYMSVGPEGTYEEWTYTTSDGVDVLMVIERGGVRGSAEMIVDRGNYVFVFTVSEFPDMPLPSREELEAYAEVFDFTVQPQQVSQADLEAVVERHEIAAQAWAAEHEKKLACYTEKGYGDRIKFQMENCIHPEELGFALMDIDGNGVDDLLVGQHGYFRAAYTQVDEGTQHMTVQRLLYEDMLGYDWIGTSSSIGTYNMYLCEDGCLAHAFETVEGIKGYHFAKPVNGKLQWAEQVQYDPVHYPDNPWQSYDADYRNSSITEEQFNEIVASHVRKAVDLFPVSEFPLKDDSPSGIGMPNVTYDSFDALVRARTDWDGDRSNWGYVWMDLDGDGKDELLWKEGIWKGVLTVKDGEVKLLAGGEHLAVTDKNAIILEWRYPDGNSAWCCYKMENGEAVLIDYLRYDAHRNPENPWLRSSDANGQDTSLFPISEKQFISIKESHVPIALDWQPVDNYPLK